VFPVKYELNSYILRIWKKYSLQIFKHRCDQVFNNLCKINVIKNIYITDFRHLKMAMNSRNMMAIVIIY
jgi:uncharacterized membrane protein YoaT (DUF817 family)